jgi:hypothetical protein
VGARQSLLLACLLLCSASAFAQSADADKDPAAIIELGAAAGLSLKDGASGFGPDFAVEFAPIENWVRPAEGRCLRTVQSTSRFAVNATRTLNTVRLFLTLCAICPSGASCRVNRLRQAWLN